MTDEFQRRSVLKADAARVVLAGGDHAVPMRSAPETHNVRPLLAARLSALARRHGVPGAQLAIHHDGETIAFEVGEAEHRTGQKVRRDTAFPVGSITKAFTATVAMILVADGDLELDAPVGEHLPELNGLGDDITLAQLLSHTSGFVSGPEVDDASSVSLRRYVKDHCHRGNLVLPCGTGFSYSNMGYIVVGRLIETITGMSWQEAMESILLRPLGITPAFVGPSEGKGMRPKASGHSVNLAAGRTRAVPQQLTAAEAPTGALAVSATDLVALGRLHLDSGNTGLLPAGHTALMRRDIAATVPFGLADGWGCGLALFHDGDTSDARTTWAGHDGNADGTSCYLRIDPAGGWIVAFTSNANTGAAMWRDLLTELDRSRQVPIGQRPPWLPTGRPVPPPHGCAGTYANGDVEFVVNVRDVTAYLSVDGQPFTALTVYEDLSFSVRDPHSGAQVLAGCFTDDPVSHRVNGIQLGGRIARPRPQTVRESRQRRIA
ncbi:MAG TPA: serine hydrolase domain-containing protein [Candidatus Limnocylindrales bacterium]|nr:serine hydrolase domain-containing protein [Candidatus Limnocylindrales bacterium]